PLPRVPLEPRQPLDPLAAEAGGVARPGPAHARDPRAEPHASESLPRRGLLLALRHPPGLVYGPRGAPGALRNDGTHRRHALDRRDRARRRGAVRRGVSHGRRDGEPRARRLGRGLMSAAVLPAGPRRLGLVSFYAAAALLCFPVLEILISGTRARVYAHDVFDDGAVSRLGALRLDAAAFGPVLWNRHLMSGNAYFGQFVASPLAVDNLLSLVTTPFFAFAACSGLLCFLSGLSMHLFLE